MQLLSIQTPKSPAVPVSPSTHGVKRQCRILVVDDDRSVRQAFTWALQDLDCLIVAAANLPDAVAQMTRLEFTPDAVIVDFHLDDGVSGFDVIRLLRRLFSVDLPAVTITGDAAVSDSDEQPFQDIRCLSKPVKYSDLDGLIAEIRAGIDQAPVIADPGASLPAICEKKSTGE
jgi:CheY-like chemotaxis protein